NAPDSGPLPPLTVTGLSLFTPRFVLPSWPWLLRPQQNVNVALFAQLCAAPTAMFRAWILPLTTTAVSLPPTVNVLSPNWPTPSPPQQRAADSAAAGAQLWATPAAIAR